MKIESRRTGFQQILKIEEWDMMEKNDPGSQRKFIVLDSSDLQLSKAEKIDIKVIHPLEEKIEIENFELSDVIGREVEPTRQKMRKYFDANQTTGYYKSMTTPKMLKLYKTINNG